ncbi:hypothetical protein SAMN04515666_101348 [Bosea lupini]|uniref:Uncharacterized protein n=1 Tax=Bosea lupini TaxID=1036779 RepID=A0A1H7GJN1_9HYPH|nr:hypothetical protein [Bosea lupini]SEK37182.1 hypothetical protein SAMN04515666_101348 [Bosea lupini]
MTQEIPLSLLKQQAEASGWAIFDDEADPNAPKRPRALSEAEQRWAEACARVLASEDGEIMMEGLLDRTVRREAWAYEVGADPLQIAMRGVRREGQNTIPHMLLQAAARGRQEQPPAPRE